MRWHKHHIIPKHMGGTDDPSNLLKCNVAMHAFLHKQLYLELGHWQDLLAWNVLTGQIGKDEILRIKNQEAGRMGGRKVGKMLFENRIGIFSPEKIGQGMRGKKLSDDAKRKIGMAQLGSKNHNYGKPLSEDVKLKISKTKQKLPKETQFEMLKCIQNGEKQCDIAKKYGVSESYVSTLKTKDVT